MICDASDCMTEGVISWQRYATFDELLGHMPPEQIPGAIEDGATVMVYACSDHMLLPMDLMAMTHQVGCPAPPECTCPVIVLPIAPEDPATNINQLEG